MNEYLSTQGHLCLQAVGEQLCLGYASGGALVTDLFMDAVDLGIVLYYIWLWTYGPISLCFERM